MGAPSLSRLLAAALVIATLAAGQSVQPSNATLDGSESQTEFQLGLDAAPPAPGKQFYTIAPLTEQVGKGSDGQNNGIQQTSIPGEVTPVSDQTTSVGKSDIAYISCDPTQGNINASTVVGQAAAASPKAIVLYSLQAQECELNGSYPYTTIYTMISSGDSSLLLNSLKPNGSLSAVISFNGSSNGNTTDPTGTTPAGPPPTTAVAMSILYSITGIITLLFLIVIASGAIRAHRHPERYGPRAAVTGRARQSRAKGLARAMLETLPIVKFGDPEPVKPGATDIELEDGTSSVHHTAEVTGAAASAEIDGQLRNAPATATAESEKAVGGDQAKPTSETEASAENAPTGELGCSICTEDFTTGEDVRVLPCHHKYHPACIDPWLLNVSGTCPLCRHDLNPAQPGAEGAEGAEGDELPPPLAAEDGSEHTAEASTEAESSADPSHRHRLRVSRLLDLTRLRTAPPEERIAALRQLREQSQQEGESATTGDQQSRSAGLTSRLREKFHIRTRTENPPE